MDLNVLVMLVCFDTMIAVADQTDSPPLSFFVFFSRVGADFLGIVTVGFIICVVRCE